MKFGHRPQDVAGALGLLLLTANIFVSPSFLTWGRLPSTLATLAPFILVGFASTPAILSGGIDVSVGPLATLINCLFVATLIPEGLGDWWIAVPILLSLATAVGAINGFLVAIVRLHPVIATTGSLFVVVGLALTIAPTPIPAPANWSEPLADQLGPIPGAVVLIAGATVLWLGLKRSQFVSNVLATGDSDVSAYGAGVDIATTRVLAYALGGLFAGFAGIALSALLQSSQSSLATTYALLGLAAAVLGGADLGGGRGTLLGVFLGAIDIYLIQQLLTASGVAPSLIQLAYGLVLVASVVLGATVLRSRTPKELT